MHSHLGCVKYFAVVPVCLAECLTLKFKLPYISNLHCLGCSCVGAALDVKDAQGREHPKQGASFRCGQNDHFAQMPTFLCLTK